MNNKKSNTLLEVAAGIVEAILGSGQWEIDPTTGKPCIEPRHLASYSIKVAEHLSRGSDLQDEWRGIGIEGEGVKDER
jgi:hypothetical protein